MAKNSGKAPRDILSSERTRTFAYSVRRAARSIYPQTVERAFEEAGCSCSPYRTQLKELQVDYDAQKKTLWEEYHRQMEALDKTDLGENIRELDREIQKIDRKEHPSLDREGRKAYPFLPVWLMDQVRLGNDELLVQDDESISKTYAAAWYGGWRPKAMVDEPRFKPKRAWNHAFCDALVMHARQDLPPRQWLIWCRQQHLLLRRFNSYDGGA